MDASQSLFESIKQYSDVERMIEEGQTENLYLETKAPTDSEFDKYEKMELAKNVSAFANTEGGVIIYGIKTEKYDNQDRLMGITGIGVVDKFSKSVLLQLTQQTTPSVTNYKYSIIKKDKKLGYGILAIYIPKASQPTQSLPDRQFYVRNGDESIRAEYHTIERLFALSKNPDLRLYLAKNISSRDKEGHWSIKITITNKSRIAPERAKVTLLINNPGSVETLLCEGFREISEYNPGKKMFSKAIVEPVYKGLDIVIGTLKVKMAKGSRPKRLLEIKTKVLANDMEPRETILKLNITSGKVTTTEEVV